MLKRRLAFLFILVLASEPHLLFAMAKKPPLETAKELPPLGLMDAYRLSLKRSEDLAIKRVTVEESWADFFKASSNALGTVDYDITDSFQEHQRPQAGESSSSGSSFTRDETRGQKFVISQPLFQGFKAVGALAGAGSLRKERIYDKNRAEQLLFQDVATTFFAVQRFEKEVKILSETHQLLQERVTDLDKREQIGKSRISEVTNAQTRMQTIESDLAEAEGNFIIQKRILEFLTGVPIEGRTLQETARYLESPLPLEKYMDETENRFDVTSAEQAMRVAFQNVVVTQSRLWPKVTVDSNVYNKREGGFQSNIDWDVLLTMKIPLFQGGGAIGEIKSAYLDWKKAKLNYEKTKRMAELDLKQSYSKWITVQKKFRALEAALKTSEDNYKLQKEDYSRNLVSNLEVLSALESFNQTREQTNQVYYQLQEYYWRFQIARGNCCESR